MQLQAIKVTPQTAEGHYTVILNLITQSSFIRETGMDRRWLERQIKRGSVTGLVPIAGTMFVDRTQVHIHYERAGSGHRFKKWIELGGRAGAVSVPQWLAEQQGTSGQAVA